MDKRFVHSFFLITLISGQSGQGVDKMVMLKKVIRSVGYEVSGQSGQGVDKLKVLAAVRVDRLDKCLKACPLSSPVGLG